MSYYVNNYMILYLGTETIWLALSQLCWDHYAHFSFYVMPFSLPSPSHVCSLPPLPCPHHHHLSKWCRYEANHYATKHLFLNHLWGLLSWYQGYLGTCVGYQNCLAVASASLRFCSIRMWKMFCTKAWNDPVSKQLKNNTTQKSEMMTLSFAD